MGETDRGVLVFLCVHTTAAATVLAVDPGCKAVAVQLEALGLLAIAPLGTTAKTHSTVPCYELV